MSFDTLTSGSVLDYPYLWKREALRGETEGRKTRPSVLAVRLKRDGGDQILLFPITSKPPGSDTVAIEIPDAEKQRASLDPEKRLWIVVSEFNLDMIGRSFYLSPGARRGRFSKAFFKRLRDAFSAQRRAASGVSRT